MPGNFIDTNILAYLASDDTAKAARAEEIVASGGAISVQVLNELANVARRKMRLSWPETNSFLTVIRSLLTVHPLTAESHLTGLALAERHSLSIYNAMVVASALHADCDRLWSEDMQSGMTIAGRMTIANPFNA